LNAADFINFAVLLSMRLAGRDSDQELHHAEDIGGDWSSRNDAGWNGAVGGGIFKLGSGIVIPRRISGATSVRRIFC
jgi:hypothetical protein